MKRNRGFTLIELLVVISIISVLAVLVFAVVSSARQRSRDAVRVSDMNQIKLALELYNNSNDGYPGPVIDYGERSPGCGWDTSALDVDGDGISFIDPLVEGGFMVDSAHDPMETPGTACGDYNYYYYLYDAGANGCDASRGKYYVLGIKEMELSGMPHPDSPGWSCSGRNWNTELEWVTGGYVK